MTDNDDTSSRRRRALGKGLGALIPNDDGDDERKERYVELPVAQIKAARRQPRTEFDDQRLRELAESIAESGLIQPLVVREKRGSYELIAGERRLRACEIADIETAPAVIKDVTDTEAYTLALVENVQREDLNPVEEAIAYQKLLSDTGASKTELAEQLGKSRSALSNSVRLLELPDDALDLLAVGRISSGHARALISLDDRAANQMAKRIVTRGWSVRKTEEEVRKLNNDSDADDDNSSSTSRYRDDALVRDLTERLQHSLGTKVKVKDRDGKGKIEIHYEDVDILQSVLDQILDDE